MIRVNVELPPTGDSNMKLSKWLMTATFFAHIDNLCGACYYITITEHSFVKN